MNLNLKNNDKTAKTLSWAIFAVFAILTFILMLNRTPFFDEAHAWMVSKSFNLIELFKIEKFEGHLFIWHFLLMPFSKNDLFYPYSMYILNWIFCILSMFVFWKFSPFKQIEKTLITFSFPIFWYFAQVARCYSIGLLFLFLILTLWKERTKKPILISFLLILLANTSAMALIGAFALGLIFIFDILKEKIDKKNLIYSFLILFFGATLVGIQLFGAYHPDIEALFKEKIFFFNLITYFYFIDFKHLTFSYIFNKITAIVALLTILFSFLFLFKNKRSFFFLTTTYLLMFLLFTFKYSGAWWHYLFFYIYLISAIWLYRTNENSKNIFQKPFQVLFLSLISLFTITTIFFDTVFNSEVYHSRTKEIYEIIKKEKLFEGKKIYALDNFSQTSTGIMPYLKDIKIYNVFGDEKYSKEEYKHYMKKEKRTFLIDEFATSLDENKINLGISDRKMFPYYMGENYYILLKPFFKSEDPNFIIYSIDKMKK